MDCLYIVHLYTYEQVVWYHNSNNNIVVISNQGNHGNDNLNMYNDIIVDPSGIDIY